MDVNSLNAIAQERARIREGIVKLHGINVGIDMAHEKLPEGEMPMSITFNGGTFVRLLDVLAVIEPRATVSERKETDESLSACCNARMVAGGVQCESCGSDGQ